jgi:hypothetical protein
VQPDGFRWFTILELPDHVANSNEIEASMLAFDEFLPIRLHSVYRTSGGWARYSDHRESKIQAFQGYADSPRAAFGRDLDKVQYLVKFS